MNFKDMPYIIPTNKNQNCNWMLYNGSIHTFSKIAMEWHSKRKNSLQSTKIKEIMPYFEKSCNYLFVYFVCVINNLDIFFCKKWVCLFIHLLIDLLYVVRLWTTICQRITCRIWFSPFTTWKPVEPSHQPYIVWG